MFRRLPLFVVSLQLFNACASSPPPEADKPADKSADASATGFTERALTLASGTKYKVAAEWTVTERDDGVTLEGPEKILKLELVEVSGSEDMAAAVSKAWKSRSPTFAREQAAASDSPGREGWDAMHRAEYKRSPEENRAVVAMAARKGKLVVVLLIDVPLDAMQRRISQVLVVRDSLHPEGYTKEVYAGRTPKPIDAEKIASLRGFITEAMQTADVPGLSIALFDKDEIFLEESFGVRERGGAEKVTNDTRFIIASNTKPLTTLLLARLVDQGKLTWQTPVTDVYPEFKLGNAETTTRMQVKHLICACTGLPRQDLEWVFTFPTSSPAKQFDVLSTMVPTTEFGALFQYSNPLAAAAGFVAGHAVKPGVELGQAFDEAMQEQVFAPLGMTKTTFSFDEALKANHASPHSMDMSMTNVPIAMGLNLSIVPVRPAGGAWSTAGDFAKYVQMELAKGRLPDGSTYLTEEVLLARREPQVRIRESAWYGMGLWLSDTKELRVINHGGSLFGYQSDFFFAPETGIGAVILTNADTGYFVADAIKRRVLELVYDGKPEAAEDLADSIGRTKKSMLGEQKDWAVPPNAVATKRLASTYRNPDLGDVKIVREGDRVFFELVAFRSEVATKSNPDGTTSFVTIQPSVRGLDFTAPAGDGAIKELTLRDPQHVYPFQAVE